MTDPLFQRTADGDVYHYHNDHLGTPQQLVDASGNVVWAAQYSAFCNAYVTVNAVENNLRFPGQYFDVETGLHQNYFRDYDSELGRYIQSDPIGLAGGNNTYGYAYQSPVINYDPTGEFVPALFLLGLYAECVLGCSMNDGVGAMCAVVSDNAYTQYALCAAGCLVLAMMPQSRIAKEALKVARKAEIVKASKNSSKIRKRQKRGK